MALMFFPCITRWDVFIIKLHYSHLPSFITRRDRTRNIKQIPHYEARHLYRQVALFSLSILCYKTKSVSLSCIVLTLHSVNPTSFSLHCQTAIFFFFFYTQSKSVFLAALMSISSLRDKRCIIKLHCFRSTRYVSFPSLLDKTFVPLSCMTHCTSSITKQKVHH